MAEYFDVDPALVRLLWVGAAVVSGGLAVPVYILAWVILPREERAQDSGPHAWRDWSHEFHGETQRLADEARRAGQSWRAPEPTEPTAPASEQGAPGGYTNPASEEAWWSEREADRHRHHGRHPRSTGIVLVALGVLLLAANSGVFRLVEWRVMWPMIFIGLGIILLARQSRWGR